MICTVQELQKFSNVYTDEDTPNLQTVYLKSAQQVIESYLGYEIEEKEYKRTFDGLGFSDLRLMVRNITEIKKVVIDGKEIDPSEFIIDDDSIVYKNGTFKAGRKNIYVEYIGGFSEVPEIMKLTALRIGSLLQLEEDQNIGVSSRSFADQSRTFINTTNYDKYLMVLSRYKLLA